MADLLNLIETKKPEQGAKSDLKVEEKIGKIYPCYEDMTFRAPIQSEAHGMELLTCIQAIVTAVGAKDYDAMSRAAGRIGYSEQMGQMCNHMGAGAPGFTEQALHFHHTADKISEAAKRRDMPAVLSALGETLATCTGCHAVFKQKIVDENTWASLTGASAGTPPKHHP